MAARRNRTPPYEIMNTGSRSLPADGGAAPRVREPERPAEPAGETPAWWSWAGVGVPIILRVPRGVAILIAAGLIGLLVLAYWVGHARGWAAADHHVRAEMTENPGAAARGAPGNPPDGGSSQATAGTTGTAGTSDPGSQGRGIDADPRQHGLNYFVVARYPENEARRLAAFLKDRGVETVLDPLDNGLVKVWAVDQGFTAQQLDGPAYSQYQNRLRSLGQAWREHNDGQGDAFETMYPDNYEGD